MLIDKYIESKIKVYAFVGPSGTGKSYRAQMVASEYNIRLNDPEDGKKIISDLITLNKTIVKYELREPSLHEIFIEKVGKN